MNETCGASPKIMGKHEEKLSNLENGQASLTNGIQEVKSDLKELIELLKYHLEQSQEKLEQRQQKMEDELSEFKQMLFSLLIKAVLGVSGIGLMALAWYANKLSDHIIK